MVRGLASEPEGEPDQSYSDELDVIELMAVTDLNQYLPEDILTKLDRTSMAVSLESRVPLLDHDVVAFALSLPLSYKRSNGTGKIVLRKVLEKYVPREIIDRPKKGFSVPVAEWIRGPLRGWAEDLIQKSRSQHGQILDGDVISDKWQEHLSGRRDPIGIDLAGVDVRIVGAEMDVNRSQFMDHLSKLENQSVYIPQGEAYNKFENLGMLWSISKDSTVLLSGSRARRSSAMSPFPLVHVDTTYKIPSMIEYRDKLVKRLEAAITGGQK